MTTAGIVIIGDEILSGKFVEENAPLRRTVTIDQVGDAAVFLLSDLSAGVTGEIMMVDGGFSRVVGGIDGASGAS